MSKEALDLRDINKAILKLLKEEFNLQPKVISVGIVLAREEFNILAENHPDAVLPDLLRASNPTGARSLQWAIHIQPETTIKDFPPEVQKRLTPPPD